MCTEDSNQSDEERGQESEETDDPKPKRFKCLKDLLSKKQKLQCNTSTSDNTAKSRACTELTMYTSRVDISTTESIDDDPFIFWLSKKESFPLLSKAAFDLLSTPASTAPVERIFSTGGDATIGHRNRLSDYNLEREILIRQNKKYIE